MTGSSITKPTSGRSLLRSTSIFQVIGAVTAGMLLVSGAQAADFIPLGDLPGGEFGSRAAGVSADGSVVVGNSEIALGREAFVWTSDTGMVGLGDLPGGDFSSQANAVSADGSVVVGSGESASGGEAFRWTSGTGMVGLDDLAGAAQDVSADGSVVVGGSDDASGFEAFRWTSGTGPVGLGNLPGGVDSGAGGVSADGSVVVGGSGSGSYEEAFRWTAGTGMVGLGGLPGGSTRSGANDVSADGSVVVGWSYSASGIEAFRWTSGTDMVGLGDLPGGNFHSEANAASADGSVVVGYSESASGREAFVWTQAHGMQSLRDLLLANGATGLDNWVLDSAADISADGQWVVGRGINPSGGREAYLANISPALVPISAFPLASATAGGAQAAVIGDSDGQGQAIIKDVVTGAPISDFDLTGGLTVVAGSSITDQNNNNADDLALLMFDEAAVLPKVEVRDSVTGAKLKNVNYNKNHVPVALAIIEGQQGVVLAKQTSSNNRGRILIRDLQTKAKINNVSLPKIFDVLALAMGPDINGNGRVDAYVLATRLSDGKGFVLVWDTGGAGKIVNVQLPKQHEPIAHDSLTGPGGVAALAVLALRTTDDRGRVFVYDALTGVKLWAATLGVGQTPVALRSFQTAGGGTRVAALVNRTSDSRPIVRIYNGNTGLVVDNIAYDAGQTPVDLVLFPDTSLDGNANPELGVLVNPGSHTELRVRDSVTKALLQTISLP